MVRLLLENGPDATAVDEEGNTALHIAASFLPYDNWDDDRKVMKLLLRHGPNVNTQNRLGNTALHVAASKHQKAVDLLIKAGADNSLRNSEGFTANYVARGTDSRFLGGAWSRFRLRYGMV